ncbi:MAG TPA: hypothetical protein PLV68_08950, partial [Ilumatobacteraceae bacterium]|nr:hypothetical protein [Ilumatobacteraceae bacterium]
MATSVADRHERLGRRLRNVGETRLDPSRRAAAAPYSGRMAARVLIVDDEPMVREVVARYL